MTDYTGLEGLPRREGPLADLTGQEGPLYLSGRPLPRGYYCSSGEKAGVNPRPAVKAQPHHAGHATQGAGARLSLQAGAGRRLKRGTRKTLTAVPAPSRCSTDSTVSPLR